MKSLNEIFRKSLMLDSREEHLKRKLQEDADESRWASTYASTTYKETVDYNASKSYIDLKAEREKSDIRRFIDNVRDGTYTRALTFSLR